MARATGNSSAVTTNESVDKAQDNSLEQLIKGKVEEILSGIQDIRGGTKAARDVAALIMPGIANIISVAVSTAVSNAVKDVANTLMKNTNDARKYCLLNKYENDRLEQYIRRDNLRIAGLIEEANEDEQTLLVKTIEVAADMGATVEPSDIATVHRLGKPGTANRPVIVRFNQRHRRNEMLVKKRELKKKGRNIYVNEDLTPLRASLLKIVKEQDCVSNATTRDGRILAWLKDNNRRVEVNTPADLHRVGVNVPDWKRLKLDHIVSE